MRRTDAYLAPPGKCACCGSAQSGVPIIDLEIYDTNHGLRRDRIYLCGVCVIDAASRVAADLGKAVVAADVAGQYAATVDQLETAELRVLELEDLLERIKIATGATS